VTLALAAIASVTLSAPRAFAAEARPIASAKSAPQAPARLVEVRLALSQEAAQNLSEARVRRLLEIELEENAILAPTAVGPLGDHVAYVWVDQPSPALAVIEVRVGDRPVARRRMGVQGLAGDVAARLVAIAAAEMVRAQMQPVRPPPRRPPPPRGPTPEEIEHASRMQPALMVSPGASAAFLPSADGFLAGPSVGVGFRDFGLSETLFGRWFSGSAGGGVVRWLEVGLAAEYRVWLSPSWRLAFGGAAAVSSLHFTDATLRDGAPNERDTWSARAGARVGVEARLATPLWLTLAIEPGAILRPVAFTDARGAGSVEGLWLGLDLGLRFEYVRKPVLAPQPAN